MSVIWQNEPPFGEESLNENTKRYKIGGYHVDWNEAGTPTLAIIQQILGIDEQGTINSTIARLEAALDEHLDNVAKSYRYESIRTMVTYATSEHPIFGNEGRAAVKYRDAVYAYGIKCIQDVQAGLRPIPTESELVSELPAFTDYL